MLHGADSVTLIAGDGGETEGIVDRICCIRLVGVDVDIRRHRGAPQCCFRDEDTVTTRADDLIGGLSVAQRVLQRTVFQQFPPVLACRHLPQSAPCRVGGIVTAAVDMTG